MKDTGSQELMNWLIWLFLGPGPLVIGFLWGAWLGRRESFSPYVLLSAPIVSGPLAFSGSFAVNLILGEPNPRDTIVGLAIVFVIYGGIFILVTAVPALIGCTVGQFGKMWLYRRAAGIPQSEYVDQ